MIVVVVVPATSPSSTETANLPMIRVEGLRVAKTCRCIAHIVRRETKAMLMAANETAQIIPIILV